MKEIKEIYDLLMEIKTDVAVIKNNSENHIQRTNMIEKKIKQINEDMQPIRQHVDRVQFLIACCKWVGVSTVIAAITGLLSSNA
jgi:uncharacterized protein YoxC